MHTLLFRSELFMPFGCAGEKISRTSRPKLKSGSYIARSIKMSINPRRYRCLLLLLAFSPSLPHSTPISRCLIYLFSPSVFFFFLLERRSRESQVRGSSISISLGTRLDSQPLCCLASRYLAFRRFDIFRYLESNVISAR